MKILCASSHMQKRFLFMRDEHVYNIQITFFIFFNCIVVTKVDRLND